MSPDGLADMLAPRVGMRATAKIPGLVRQLGGIVA